MEGTPTQTGDNVLPLSGGEDSQQQQHQPQEQEQKCELNASENKKRRREDEDEEFEGDKKSKRQDSVIRKHPHLRQVFDNPSAGYELRDDIPFQRVLSPDYPQKSYRRRKGEIKSVIHWGQRKLLLSEIEFLVMHGGDARTVVYAGAAPGTHIKILSEMFPHHNFYLVDPAPFTVKSTDRISCHQALFTDEIAETFKGKDTLFISDIRSADWQQMEEEETDQRVSDDQQAQMRWHRIMKPKWSMLKFRLPWYEGETEYLDGTVYLPIWGPITTTESRLICAGDCQSRKYNHKTYEEQLFHFNTTARPALYDHSVVGEGIDGCYDCRAEVHTLQQYLQTEDGKAFVRSHLTNLSELDSMDAKISDLSALISRECAKDRTLASPNPDPEERRNVIRSRQWIQGQPAYEYMSRSKDLDERLSTPSVYSQASQSMMGKMGFKTGGALGRDGTGVKQAVRPKHQYGNRGLGFDVVEDLRSQLERSSGSGGGGGGKHDSAAGLGFNTRQDRYGGHHRHGSDSFHPYSSKYSGGSRRNDYDRYSSAQRTHGGDGHHRDRDRSQGSDRYEQRWAKGQTEQGRDDDSRDGRREVSNSVRVHHERDGRREEEYDGVHRGSNSSDRSSRDRTTPKDSLLEPSEHQTEGDNGENESSDK